jgi:hypothetical protein
MKTSESNPPHPDVIKRLLLATERNIAVSKINLVSLKIALMLPTDSVFTVPAHTLQDYFHENDAI